MSNPPGPRTKATIALVGIMLAALAALLSGLAGTALAAEPTGYGELTRFAESGDGEGQLDETRTLAIGVNPTDNSFFSLDEYKRPTSKKRFLRLQKFSANGAGAYGQTASKEFTEEASEEGGGVGELAVQGLAVDPSEKRVYLLVVNIRQKALSQDAEAKENGTSKGLGLPVATALYAFSTEGLAEASGTKAGTGGILDGPAELNAQSVTPGQALLEPHGITVDPATHEVIVLAHEDSASNKYDELCAEPSTGNPCAHASDHYVLQRIKPNGTLGERYVDKTNVLKEEQETGVERFARPNSPVVVSVAGGKERVYIDANGLTEIPDQFEPSTPPKFTHAPLSRAISGGITPQSNGGGLSSAEGVIYAPKGEGILNEEDGLQNGSGVGGVMAISGESLTQIGWTGGAEQRESEPQDKCVVSQREQSLVPLVAAGSGGKVFALGQEFLLRKIEEEEEIELPPEGSEEFETITIVENLPPPFFPAVIEFGPGGTGCPQASATPLQASANGKELKSEESVKVGSEVTFLSHIKQADALKVEWNFGDGSTGGGEVSKESEDQAPTITHKYTTEGTFTATAKIYIDDLAGERGGLGQSVFNAGLLSSPALTLTRTIAVGAQPPKASFTAKASGLVASFANLSSDPNGAEALPLKYAWAFGDGATSTEAAPTHAYAAAGTYTVKLTVTDKLGLTSTASLAVTVASAPPPVTTTQTPPPPPATTTSTAVAPATTKPATGGVLSYAVHLGASTLSVSKAGAFALKVDCGGQSSCTGSAVLRTASAVSSGAGKRKAVLTLTSGSFAIAGGQGKSLSLHLSGKARTLLAHLHVLRAKVSIVARDAAGVAHTTTFQVTLRAAKQHH